MTTKYKIAKMIAGAHCFVDNPTYEQLLEAIYENEYRTIAKCPVNIFFQGIVSSFVDKSLETSNRLLKLVKEVVQEALELSGIELTFVDEDWQKLQIMVDKSWRDSQILSIDGVTKYKNKSYMGEFFE